MLYKYFKKYTNRPARLLEAILKSLEGLFSASIQAETADDTTSLARGKLHMPTPLPAGMPTWINHCHCGEMLGQ